MELVANLNLYVRSKLSAKSDGLTFADCARALGAERVLLRVHAPNSVKSTHLCSRAA